jgi:glycosyltransferase involved in cell wall biosynthesis
MGQAPAISITMPVYNAMPFLPEAIRSVVAQGFQDWELIAIDDGSTDDSWDFLQRLNDPRIRIFRNERNLGVCPTLNRAFDECRGKWIARMDADDVIFVERLEKQVAALEADPRIDCLGTGSFVTDRELNPVIVRRATPDHHLIVRWPSLYFILTFGALMGKAEWWKKWRMDPRVGISGHEFDLYFRSYRESLFSNVPDPVYVYRFFGHTRSWSKMTKSVYYKMLILARHGLRPGQIGSTLLGLASLVPRPLFYAVKMAAGSQKPLASAGAGGVSAADLALLAEGLKKVRAVELPLKEAAS